MNGSCRAGRRTGCFDVSVLQGPVFHLSFQLTGLDTLYTEGTFLHDATGPNHYIRIQGQFAQIIVHVVIKLVVIGVIEPIEPAHLEGTVIGAVAGAETAVIGLHRSEEHTSELQSLMRTSYAVFCLKKKKKQHT